MHKNQTVISGKVTSINISHTLPNHVFYEYTVEVPRKSGAVDFVPFIVSDKLLHNNKIGVDDIVTAQGEIRTINRMVDNKSKLILFNYVNEIRAITAEQLTAIEDKNIVSLQGYVVKKPVYRETPNGLSVTELLIAHNRSFGKESYIPTIAWGLDAKLARQLIVSEIVELKGRFQSRNYTTSSGESKMAYELSIHSGALQVLD